MSVKISVQKESFKLIVSDDGSYTHNGAFESRFISLSACRNSYAAFQLLLQSPHRLCVGLTEDPWFSEYEDAQVISVRHRGELKPVLNHIALHLGDDEREYADRLMNDPVFTVAADKPHSVFVRFEIPEDIAPGIYDGCFDFVQSHLFSDETVIATVSYSLEIFACTLPKLADRSFALDLWQHNCNIARKAAVPNWSDRHFALIDQYLETLAQIGQRTVTVIASEVPWSGQRCFLEPVKANMFEYSMIRVFETAAGYRYDYSVLDRYIELCFRHGIDRIIEVFGLIGNWVSDEHGYGNFTEMPEAIRVRYKTVAGTYRYMSKASELQDYIIGLHKHFEEMGWLDKVVVVADEPANHEALRGSIEAVRAIAPGFRYKAAFFKKNFYDEFKDVISDFCIVSPGIAYDFDDWKRIFKEDKAHTFTYYVCCWPRYPNTLLDSSLLEARYIPAFAHYFGLSGFLRWNYTVWPENPREMIRYPKWPAGDTNFVYPGADGTPELSLRYMALRRGVEDFELLELLKQQGREDVVGEFYRSVITTPDITKIYEDGNCLVDFRGISSATQEDYDSFRRRACEALNT